MVKKRSKRVPKLGVLRRLQKLWPEVDTVEDAQENVIISVLSEDQKATRADPGDCALARACVREGIADIAIIGKGISYLIKDNVATRYHTPESVAREIVSFDRHGDFAPGKDYHLGKVSPSARLGHRPHHPTGGNDKSRPRHFVLHRTVRVRDAALKDA